MLRGLKWTGIGCVGLISLIVVVPLLGFLFSNSFLTFVGSLAILFVAAGVLGRDEQNQEQGNEQSGRGQSGGFAATALGILVIAVLVFGVTATGKAISRAVTSEPETVSQPTTAQESPATDPETTRAETAAQNERSQESKEQKKSEEQPDEEKQNQQEQQEQQSEPAVKPQPAPTPPPPPEPTPEEKLAERGQVVTVTRAVDGDTVEISPAIDGIEDVRLIGVDTPEMSSDCGMQPLAAEATNFTSAELVGSQVALELGSESVDRYGRLLGYVWEVDGSMFNQALLTTGLAQVYTVPPNNQYETRFYVAQQEAANAGLGIWSLSYDQQVVQNDRGNGIGGGCVAAPQPDPVPQPAPTPEPAPAAPSGVTPSPNAPDVDCSDFPAMGDPQAWMFPGDPHRLDADGDGLGCEAG